MNEISEIMIAILFFATILILTTYHYRKHPLRLTWNYKRHHKQRTARKNNLDEPREYDSESDEDDFDELEECGYEPNGDDPGRYNNKSAKKKVYEPEIWNGGGIEEDYEKVKKLVGVRKKQFDALPVIDLILQGKISSAAEKICNWLNINHPYVSISQSALPPDNKNTIAQVPLSDNEPMFGTTDFHYQTIKIILYPGSTDYPDLLISVLAHEISHKILHSLDRNRKDMGLEDEKQTDICSIISGFANSYEAARAHKKIGYLNDDEANYVLKRYRSESSE